MWWVWKDHLARECSFVCSFVPLRLGPLLPSAMPGCGVYVCVMTWHGSLSKRERQHANRLISWLVLTWMRGVFTGMRAARWMGKSPPIFFLLLLWRAWPHYHPRIKRGHAPAVIFLAREVCKSLTGRAFVVSIYEWQDLILPCWMQVMKDVSEEDKCVCPR